ncbi:MAG: hypothetical protein IKP50_02745 [Bacilli bacterium]|nr:hypothetical protein [Bacilli bacterium]
MVKRIQKFLLLVTMVLPGCSKLESNIKKPDGVMVFSPQINLINDDFDGLGVEWGAYEDLNKLQPDAWQTITKYAERMDGMSLVRCMVNFDWFCENLDKKGDKDKTNDTWTYNFTNKWMQSTEQVLSYCQAHDITVAFGAWNVIGSFPNDTWGMMDDVTSDPRWAKMMGDIIEYLVIKKGFTCIKYVVNSNEPNYLGRANSSKNAHNTFEKWRQGVLNVRAKLDSLGLNNIKIVGSDATATSDGSMDTYLYGIAQDEALKNAVGDYGIHVYPYKEPLDNGTMLNQYNERTSKIKEYDPEFGIKRKMHIWEAGLQDGKNQVTDCQGNIRTYPYAKSMANYTLTALAAGINGIAYWDFDDGMHFMYNADGTSTPKEWGMFSSLGSALPKKQQLRPWYHSSMLLMNLLRRHNVVFDSGDNGSDKNPTLRSLATISNDRNLAGVMFCNTDVINSKQVKFVLDEKYNNDEKLYVYLFNEKSALLGEDGFIVPNYEVEGSLNKINELTIPASTFVVISNKVL